MHNIGFKAVQRWYIRGWGVSKQVVCLILTISILKLYLKAICLMKFDRNWKRLRGSYKKLYDIKRIILVLKLYRGGI